MVIYVNGIPIWEVHIGPGGQIIYQGPPGGGNNGPPPNGDDYVHAFQTILDELPDSYCAMLKAHYHAPNQKNYHDCSR